MLTNYMRGLVKFHVFLKKCNRETSKIEAYAPQSNQGVVNFKGMKVMSCLSCTSKLKTLRAALFK